MTQVSETQVEGRKEVRFYLREDATAPKKWVMAFLDGTEREPSWEEIVLWLGVSNLSARVQELEADA